jgi:methylmalonyl-CoA mutase N-terminal domain/subunit
MQRQLFDNAYRLQKEIEDGTRVIVGFNKYRISEIREEPIAIHRSDPNTARIQIDKLKQVKSERDDLKLRSALEHLRETAKGKENLVPVVLDAVNAYATVGEITSALRSVWGEFNEPVGVI